MRLDSPVSGIGRETARVGSLRCATVHMDEQSLEFVREGIRRTVSQTQMKKSNPSSKQSRGQANAKYQANQQKRKPRQAPAEQNQLQTAPAAQSRVRVSKGQRVRDVQSGNGNRTVVFEEYVQDIITSGTTLAFSAASFPLQPGVSTLFAWLADQAINYQEYRFRKISFRFETDQSTGIAGKVMYAFSPDAGDPIPVNKQEMLEYGVKGKCAVWQEFEMPVPLNEALGVKRFIRSGNLAANLDIKTYDLGLLFVATQGVVATSANVGELYVKYEVELLTPVVQSLQAAQARSVRIAGGGTISTTAQFGTAPTTLNGLNITVDATGAILTFNRVGNYLLYWQLAGTGLFTAFTIPAGTQTGLTATSLGGISNAAANAGTNAQAGTAVVVSTRGATWNLGSWAGIATTLTASALRVATYSEV